MTKSTALGREDSVFALRSYAIGGAGSGGLISHGLLRRPRHVFCFF